MARSNLSGNPPRPPSEPPVDVSSNSGNSSINTGGSTKTKPDAIAGQHHRKTSSFEMFTPRTQRRKEAAANGRPSLVRQKSEKLLEIGDDIKYDWRLYSPDDHSCWHFFRWLIVGGAGFAHQQSDDELNHNLIKLGRCLTLLRSYEQKYGMPEKGDRQDEMFVLQNVVRDLYAGGVPIWSLEAFMLKVAEGLTGHKGVNWFLLPRKAFVFSPSSGSTNMFKIERGFNINKLHEMERVAVRLASFASNTRGVSDIPSRFPKPEELQRASRESTAFAQADAGLNDISDLLTQEEHAEEILQLCSESASLFSFLNSKDYSKEKVETMVDDNFWMVSDSERELFSRLAAIEAMEMMKRIDEKEKVLYPPWMITLFRFLTAGGAVGFWFNGSWQDMLISGVLAVLVGIIGQSSILSKQERIIFEVVASFAVGLIAGLIAIQFPKHTCFAAMALGGVLDILQGFRVVYAVIEIMSKHTVCGGADFLEGILFTGLIAYFLRFGQSIAARVMEKLADEEASEVFSTCNNGINELWYILIVPVTALSWSGSFTPSYDDLPLMCFHGVLGYGVNYGLSKAHLSNELNNFVSALVISTSAGLFSRFTGKSAVAYCVSGLYVLLPGAYLVTSLFSSTLDGRFFNDIIQRAIIIGLGAWSGTILCTPTVLGTTSGLLTQQSEHGSSRRLRSSNDRGADHQVHNDPMLFF